MSETEVLTCRRCDRPLLLRCEHEVQERMHYLCFHMEFEHLPLDAKEPCEAPGCPLLASPPATPDQVWYWLRVARESTLTCLRWFDPYTEPYDYDIDHTLSAHHGLMDASDMLDVTAAFLDSASRNSRHATVVHERRLDTQEEKHFEGPTVPSVTAAARAWTGLQHNAADEQEKFDLLFRRIAAAIVGPPLRRGTEEVPLPMPAYGILAAIAETRSRVGALAVRARVAQRSNAVRMYEQADEALRQALMALVLTAEMHSQYYGQRYREHRQAAKTDAR